MDKIDKTEIMPRSVYSVGKLASMTATDEDMKLINKYTLRKFTADEVFTFKVKMCDNETDDRNYMPFTLRALKDMEKLYVGRAMGKDHTFHADDQCARVFTTELVYAGEKKTKAGEPFATLVAKCYMIRTESTKDLIAEIEGGIKKEVSTNSAPVKAICSICGADNVRQYCRHFPGSIYTDSGKEKQCLITIDGVKDVYELSFVGVPAQRRAGVYKAFGDKVVTCEDLQSAAKKQAEREKIEETEMRLKIAEAEIMDMGG